MHLLIVTPSTPNTGFTGDYRGYIGEKPPGVGHLAPLYFYISIAYLMAMVSSQFVDTVVPNRGISSGAFAFRVVKSQLCPHPSNAKGV